MIGSVLPERVVDAFAAGRETPVPSLIGSTDAELSDADFRTAPGRERSVEAAAGGVERRRTAALPATGALGR